MQVSLYLFDGFIFTPQDNLRSCIGVEIVVVDVTHNPDLDGLPSVQQIFYDR